MVKVDIQKTAYFVKKKAAWDVGDDDLAGTLLTKLVLLVSCFCLQQQERDNITWKLKTGEERDPSLVTNHKSRYFCLCHFIYISPIVEDHA